MKCYYFIIVFEQWLKTQDLAGNPQYSTCKVSGKQPNAWLVSNPIAAPSAIEKVDFTIVFNTRNCTVLGADNFCKEYFDFYIHQSMTPIAPDPLRNNVTYEKIAEIAAPILSLSRITNTFGVEVRGKYIVLAFHDQGSCSSIHYVSVSYYLCPEFIVVSGLVSLPRFTAPANNAELVVGTCVANAVYYQGNITAACRSDGVWNISSLKGRCVCREDMENNEGECKGI